jgi:hypothetical protein
VSKYIGNISISLNAVFPKLPDYPDVPLSPDLCILGWEVGSVTCPISSKRYSSMSGSEPYLRLPTIGLPTQLNGATSPPPALRVFWKKRTEPMTSPNTVWTGINRTCGTIGSRDTLRTPTLVSASSFGSHAAALTRYTSPPKTVGNSGSTRQSLS